MKILFHLNSMGRGGAERVVSILSRSFAEKGYEVVLATQWVSDNEYKLHPKVRRVSVGLTQEDANKGRIAKAFCRLFRLRECVKKERPDLVISFCCKANFRSAYSMFGMSTPLIVSVRNNPVVDYAGHKFSTWYMEKKAAGCVFQTPDAMSFFTKNFQDRSVIIFNPLSEVYLDNNHICKPEDRKKEIVNVGRISKQKNQLLLVKAYDNIHEIFPEYMLKIYGDVQDNDVYEELQTYVKEHQLTDKICFMGTTDSIKQEIQDASLFVLSSDYEGMPNALIEAMVVGLPSISTDCPCGGSALLIEERKSGLLVPVADVDAMGQAIITMLSDRDKAEAMGQEARKLIEKVHPDRIVQEWVDYIESILKDRNN